MATRFFFRLKQRIFLLKNLGSIKLIRASGQFDTELYLEQNPDVAQAGVDPVWHYVTYGVFEGRVFPGRWLVKMVLRFFPWLKKHVFLLLNLGNINLIRKSGLFDEAWYLEQNPDVAQAGIDPVRHYVVYGFFERRDSGLKFSDRWYLNTYEDVRKSGINPLIHYLKYGRKLGYKTNPPIFKLGRMYDHCRETNSLVFEDAPEKIYLQRPHVVGSFSGDLGQGEALCPPAYVSVLEDVVIFGASTLVLVGEELVLDDELADFNSREFGKKALFIRLTPENLVMMDYVKKPSMRIKEGVLLSCGHDANYFHWLVECLPKLVLIDDLGLYKDAPLLIPTDLHENLMAALEKVNVHNRSVICIEPNSPCAVERLIFPSALSRVVDRYEGRPAFDVDIVLSHKWISKVSELLKKDLQPGRKPWRKLFLTRRKGLRILGNLEEIEQLVSAHGFEIVDLNGMSLDAQIELFSQASLIVAPTGAALTNMLFCPPGTKVIIFMSNHEVTNYYFWSNLGTVMKLDVTTIAGERLFKLTNYWSVHDDYSIDAKFVLEEIEKVMQIK